MGTDPITFEVVKHRLWQINDEQGITIRTISASPIVVEGNDFNVGLFTTAGDVAVVGPYVSSHVTTMDTLIKSVIRIASEISDGDIFMVNDPYIGCLHQNDLAVVSPLFHDGKIVMWAGNVLHHSDVGGIDEGSFCVNARNIFQEPPRYFLKIVNRGKLVREAEMTFALNSRLPEMVLLDLGAQIGAINVVKRRLVQLIDEKGIDVVLEVLAKSIDFAEEKLRQRISELPEGHWEGQVFMDGERVGSEKLHRVAVALEKRGDELYFDYTGSSEQVEGPVNSTYHATYAKTIVPIFDFLCGGEIDWNSSVKRCVHINAPPGTVVNAQYPAAVSICTLGFSWLVSAAAIQVVARMLSRSPKYRDRVCPSWTVSSNAVNIFGVGHKGKMVGALLSDHRGGGAGGRSFGDGFDNAGHPLSYLGFMANVEDQEWKLPVLYVFRRRLKDSGGPGKFRGGVTSISALTPYGTERAIFKCMNTAGTNQSNAAGIEGGYPGSGSQVSLVRDSNIWELMKGGKIPMTHEALGGQMQHLPSKSDGILGAGDLLVFYPPGGGGYGDPLDRDPERVRGDVLNGTVSVEAAPKYYGVKLREDLTVDKEATRREREKLIAQRLGDRSRLSSGNGFGPRKLEGEQIGEYLLRVRRNGQEYLHCAKCGEHLGKNEAEWDAKLLVREAPLSTAGPWIALRYGGQSPNFSLQETLCPGCGTLLDVREVLIHPPP